MLGPTSRSDGRAWKQYQVWFAALRGQSGTRGGWGVEKICMDKLRTCEMTIRGVDFGTMWRQYERKLGQIMKTLLLTLLFFAGLNCVLADTSQNVVRLGSFSRSPFWGKGGGYLE